MNNNINKQELAAWLRDH